MKIQSWKIRHTLTLALALVAVAIILGTTGRMLTVPSTSKIVSSLPKQQQPREVAAPVAISSIKELKIEKVFVDEHAEVNVVLLNKTGKGIQAFAVSSGNFMVITDDGLITDNPKH